MRRRGWTVWLAATLLIATGVHLGTIYALPRVVMARAWARMGPPNTMHFGTRPDAASRRVVRPNPDLLSSACPFDLSQGPLRLTARVPHSTYWSVAGFDAAANNFFVRDDAQIAGNSIEIIALRHGMKLPRSDGSPVQVIVFPPTVRGVFLLRLLIDDAKRLPEQQAIQHQASCEIAGAGDGSR